MVSKVAMIAWAVTAGVTSIGCYLTGVWGSCVVCLLVGAYVLWLLPTPPPLSIDDQRLPGKRSWLNDTWKKEKLPDDVDTIVIGSGMGGLSCAAVLARFGRKVVVFEQHDVAGGATHTFDLQGFKFDSGLHYTVPWHGHLFKLTCLRNDVPECDPLGEPDGTFDKVVLGNDAPFGFQNGDQHIHRLYKLFPEEKQGLDQYVETTSNILFSVRVFIFSKLFPLWLQPLYWKFVPAKYLPSQETAKDFLERTIKSKKLRSYLCSLWIDSGGRPDEASFMLTGAVQRGLPLEGGYYPRGGSETMGRFLISTILQYGGRVFVQAPVKHILIDPKTNTANGVVLADGTRINASLVISGTGYHNTFQHLVPEPICKSLSIPTKLSIRQSAGFLMCNIGINGTPEELDITNVNIWYLPVTKDGDIFAPMVKYFEDPITNDMPCMITWPSVKDSQSNKKGKVTCQMLAMADNDWFDEKKHGVFNARTQDYKDLKAKWEKKFLDVLYRHYPKVEGKVVFSDMSTPLTINHYLWAPEGSACGLENSPARFSQPIQKHLDPSTPINGLWLTGQDTVICGVTLAQLSGVITACRILGPANACKLFLQSVYFL
eukprot:c12316_g1_i2.p1 GENE.c12316_g1_i2~~c12316_g1_i2.p1  ORF type:complete len:600 (+),score=136.11 c12316_g1_i2:304-2103(+)